MRTINVNISSLFGGPVDRAIIDSAAVTDAISKILEAYPLATAVEETVNINIGSLFTLAKSPFKIVPQYLDDWREKYPKAMDYFIRKKPTSISCDRFVITLNDSKSGIQLAYDIHDVELIQKYFDNGGK